MSIFSGIRAGLSRIKSAVSAGVSRVRSALTGAGKAAAQVSREMPIPGELKPQAVPVDDLKAPTTHEIRDKQWEFKAAHAGTDLSPYTKSEIDDFYAATSRIWDGAPPDERNQKIKDYFGQKYGLNDMYEIYEYVEDGLWEDSDDMKQNDEAPYGDYMPNIWEYGNPWQDI